MEGIFRGNVSYPYPDGYVLRIFRGHIHQILQILMDMSAVNDIRVTSCSQFWSKIRVREIIVKITVLKIEPIRFHPNKADKLQSGILVFGSEIGKIDYQNLFSLVFLGTFFKLPKLDYA